MRKVAFCFATAAAAVAVAACGGATVDSDDVTDTPTVASEAETESETETTETAETTETSETSEAPSSSAVVSSQSKRVDDQPAREVTDVPQQASAFSPQEEAYLATLRESGVNVDGIEDQLTATGATVCADNLITRDAVAGQLVEQRRTDMDAAGVAALISDTARANLCS
ncbi:hypothetical protein CAFEA_10185 [Corynebacterium afermentans subsp. afermentans]|uniref:DUF732 domain-containing protein n=1 Tax=Corynebacterium afermentans TaxID=38286 RepID=A0A9X8R5F9_9CORY|nr:DUF732 domain-containing protein [Corynebacterium afermentans]OAA17538.1 hypothetical protein Caferm_08500 [Corynebacterium afermentans subsp. afermentans]WJY57604.1 hypothetical protein CAFEA_10185 [Corynebacterium afermentans subsp. afermentans]SIQ46445.1 hypothetical protein SAMN05421802_11522 [Corynebacterium afermentans]